MQRKRKAEEGEEAKEGHRVVFIWFKIDSEISCAQRKSNLHLLLISLKAVSFFKISWRKLSWPPSPSSSCVFVISAGFCYVWRVTATSKPMAHSCASWVASQGKESWIPWRNSLHVTGKNSQTLFFPVTSGGGWKRFQMWLSKHLEKRNKNLGGAERESKFFLDGWNGWALKWGWSSATSNYEVWEVRHYSSRLQIGTGGEIPVLGSWFVFNLSLISKIPALCVVNLGKEGAVHSWSCVCPAWLCVGWSLKSWEAAFFSFFLSCKLLSSGWSSPSSGRTSCILLTLLSKAQHGSELGRRRALDRRWDILRVYHQDSQVAQW